MQTYGSTLRLEEGLHELTPRTVYEIGCRAGEVLKQLHDQATEAVHLVGYDISPQAHELSIPRRGKRLRFQLKDFLEEKDVSFDVILLIDLIEHLADSRFCVESKRGADNKILNISLELSAQAALRSSFFTAVRQSAGHLHYFTKETALATLRDVDYEVLDYFYTGSAVDLPRSRRGRGWPSSRGNYSSRCTRIWPPAGWAAFR
jgi:hypothetical protein